MDVVDVLMEMRLRIDKGWCQYQLWMFDAEFYPHQSDQDDKIVLQALPLLTEHINARCLLGSLYESLSEQDRQEWLDMEDYLSHAPDLVMDVMQSLQQTGINHYHRDYSCCPYRRDDSQGEGDRVQFLFHCISSFNDTEGRTKEEVLERLDMAISNELDKIYA